MRECERERERESKGYVILKNYTKINLIQIFILLTKIKNFFIKVFLSNLKKFHE
jgi:hypothetical protein